MSAPGYQTHNYPAPLCRPLKVFAFDPSLGRRFSNHMTVRIAYERGLEPGPVGGKVAVLDYDFSNECWYEPVSLQNRWLLMRGGLDPCEGDPRFHQQMVYAVVCETVERFERALGRDILWGGRAFRERHGAGTSTMLRVFPHAFQQANAFYDPESCALLFGFFAASGDEPGSNLPGQTIFTCLSHDVVAHETTHAIVDSLRQHLSTPTGPDTFAFHEALADIVALFLHFSVEEALIDTIQRTGGLIFRSALSPEAGNGGGEHKIGAQLTEANPLVELARQFGEGIGRRDALRKALGQKADARLLDHLFEPHERGAILVAAVFDAFFTVYVRRTRDLMRIAGAESAIRDGQGLHPDLARRLADEAAKLATHFLDICIRAIDYCPPVDITFGEYLRAVITADRDLVPDDRHDYRGAIIAAFRARGIRPDDVRSYGEEALAWQPPEQDFGAVRLRYAVRLDGGRDPAIEGDAQPRAERDRRRQKQDTMLRRQMTKNKAALEAFARRHHVALGLDEGEVELWSMQPIQRLSPTGRIVVEFAVEFVNERSVTLADGDVVTLQGGSTVIFDHSGRVRYTIRKSLDVDKRETVTRRATAQRDYRLRMADGWAAAPFVKRDMPEPCFRMVHRGL